MATIVRRKRKDGSIAYRAQVRIKRKGKIVYHESRTFDRRASAESWARRLEIELEKPGAIEARKLSGITVGELIARYIDEVDPIKPIGRTKRYVLELLVSSPLASVSAAELEPRHIIEHCRERNLSGAGPATVAHDIAYLRSVLGMAAPAWGLPVDTRVIDQAMPTLKKLRLVGKSHRRDRRPTAEEVDRLLQAFKEREKKPQNEIPMADIFEFAIYTAMRQTEICSIRWDDLNSEKRTVIIRERKDPTNKHMNDQEVPLLGPAWGIVQRQPRISDRIFPCNPKSVGAAFTRTCAKLGIVDLRFHDLRHEAASRLFEQGYSIEQVALVTGHKDWNMLRRYTQLRPESLHKRAN